MSQPLLTMPPNVAPPLHAAIQFIDPQMDQRLAALTRTNVQPVERACIQARRFFQRVMNEWPNTSLA